MASTNIVSVNENYDLPDEVRTRLAANLTDDSTTEGAALSAMYALKGDVSGVTVGPTPPSDGFWVESPAPTVTASAPTFTDLSGTVDDEYTIPSVANVIYKVGGVVTAAGTYAASGTVEVTAEAASGYVLSGADAWSHTFSAGESVTPIAPTFDDEADEYTIPVQTGVDYQIGGSTVAAGTYSVGDVDTSVTVTAVAQSGYTLTGTTEWTGVFTASAGMWTPAGSTVLTSDSFSGSGNAESRATDCEWGGSPTTPTATVAGCMVVEAGDLKAAATGRVRYTISGSERVYFGVRIAAISSVAVDIRYGLPASGGSVPTAKILDASGDGVTLVNAGGPYPYHKVSVGDEVGLLVDGTVVQLIINGVAVETGTTAVASSTTHGFVSYAANAARFSDLVIAALA